MTGNTQSTIDSILKDYWGYNSFRPLQEDIINSVLSGNDTLALMPTGGGKSLCYQVPALARPGLCLVISPLIALKKDQVENLRKKNITAFAIYSGMSRKEVINTFKVATESNCKFLYVSPERLETSLFKEYLPGLDINLIAVDEAHCISQWGYDFRPPYLRIAELRKELTGIPVLALSASATPDVQEDICEKLKEPHGDKHQFSVFRQSFERPNLSYSVFRVDSKINKIIEVLKKVAGTGIVYCKSRKRTKEISELLQLQNISADFYHAGLPQQERSKKQEEWINNKTRVIVCTNAFGMGIDKPDVRTVVHADVPDCLENYYQEAGRAGRDGKISYAVLLYDESDTFELEEMIAVRFPSLNDIRTIYQSVSNYLQLPTGTGGGNYYEFDLTDFIRKFKLTSFTALYSLKALEQDGWLAFSEQVFLSASISFTISKEALYDFEKTHTGLDLCIKTLLRAYSGIFDQPVHISEKAIASLMKKEVTQVITDLQDLHRFGVIEYLPQTDKPQLFFPRNRIKADDIVIDMVAYNKRKEVYRQRVKQMIDYVKETSQCRSRVIGTYFGDELIKQCGVCDNCLKQKSAKMSSEEFEKIHRRIVDLLISTPLHTKELFHVLSGIKKEKIWKVLEFLHSENKVEMTNTGVVQLKS
ncbi:MAG: RecQ family ATP-dependent DNA helicase [Chitinophagaceae bacterium]|nr:RecQ family ATP-dependent DNA helicase [Chitinophagaceae bacterium]